MTKECPDGLWSVAPRVVHIIYSLGTGGLENGLINLINRCPPDRYRHAIICLDRAGHFAERIEVPDVPVIQLCKRPGHDPRMYWRLWCALRSLRPSIVHTRNMAALETQVLGLLMPGVKRVHGEHGRDVSDLDGSNPRYRQLRRWLSPLIGRFIAVSRDLQHWLIEDVGIPRDKVVQIYNGVDHERFAGGSAPQVILPERTCDHESPIVIGTVGRLAKVKDQRTLLRALARIISDQPTQREQLRAILVGDGPERELLAAEAVELGLGDAIHFAGDRSDVPAWLAAMDVFVLPSLAEGVSNTILEAMAAGLPVIATATGGNAELVEEGVTGRLVPVGDVQSLAAAVRQLADNAGIRQRMGEAGRRRVRERFDWARTVEQYLTVYDSLNRR